MHRSTAVESLATELASELPEDHPLYARAKQLGLINGKEPFVQQHVEMCLHELASMEGTELGEVWVLVDNLTSRLDYMSDEFEQAVLDELDRIKEEIEWLFRLVEGPYGLKLAFIDSMSDEELEKCHLIKVII